MWLGILKHKKYFIQGLPKGYELSHELKNVDRPRALPPIIIHYVEKHVGIYELLKMIKKIKFNGKFSIYLLKCFNYIE